MKQSLLILLLIMRVMMLSAQVEDSIQIKKISDEILTQGKAYENLRHLTKQIGNRLSGSQGMVKAESWGLTMMQESGASGAWMQELMVPHWLRGGKDQVFAIIGKEKTSLDILALGNSIGTGKKTLEAPLIMVKNFEELELKKDEIKGKIVFYNYRFNDTYISTFLAYRDASPYRGQGPSRAAKYGAAGVIVRSLTHSTDNSPHTGATRYDSNYAKIPAVAIGGRSADWLQEKIESSTNASGIKISMKTNGHFLPDAMGHNIIGELKGSAYPDEYILVGAHLDSWDVGEGAHDDGAGCVQVIEILRAFKAIGFIPKRTIRFVLFANEENGLRGGNKYAQEAKAKNEKHILAIETDAGGFTPRGLGFTGTETQFQKFLSWKNLVAPSGCKEFESGGSGADIGPLNRIMGSAMASLNPDTQRYFDIHHARTDVFEAVNKRELELGAVNLAALIYLADKYGL